MTVTLEQPIADCEQTNARLRRLLIGQNALWILALVLAAGFAFAGADSKPAGAIRTTEITIVDAQGTVRARLGGDLPDAVLGDGRVVKRGSKASGLLIYDEEGIERGGYVTQDTGSNAMLTLDSKERQAALFVAGPDKSQASALKLWTQDSAIELRSDSDGSRLTAFGKAGATLQLPVIARLPASTCADYRQLEQQHPDKRICQSRFMDAACRACMDAACRACMDAE